MLEYTDYLKFISSFVIVIFFLYAIYYLVNNYGRGILPGQKGLIKILDIKFLTRGKGIALVKVNKEYILLSFDDRGVRMLKSWSSLEGEENLRDQNDKDSS
ncbi:flagellar biosynthetic protein FliO [Persephonella sp.]